MIPSWHEELVAKNIRLDDITEMQRKLHVLSLNAETNLGRVVGEWALECVSRELMRIREELGLCGN